MAAKAALAMVNPGHGEHGGGAVLLAAMGHPSKLQHVGCPMAASSTAPPRCLPMPGPPRPPWGGTPSSRTTARAGGASRG